MTGCTLRCWNGTWEVFIDNCGEAGCAPAIGDCSKNGMLLLVGCN